MSTRRRLTAFGAAVVVVAVVLCLVLLRVDAQRVERDAAEAHRAGECRRTVTAVDGLWFGHQVVAPGAVGRASESVEACRILLDSERLARQGDRAGAALALDRYAPHPAAVWEGADAREARLRLDEAAHRLDLALTNANTVEGGFRQLSLVLQDDPGRAREVDQVVEAFLAKLPTKDACATAAITDWLGEQVAGDAEPDRAVARAAQVVPRLAPAAILACGDASLKGNPEQAGERYRQLLQQYPDHPLADRARRGTRQATLAVQLDNVTRLLSGNEPAYCDNPAPYGGAPPYRGRGGGPYRTLLFGPDAHETSFPSSWRADDRPISQAVLVICAEEATFGALADTCEYVGLDYEVRFWKEKIAVRAYELRTGALLTDTTIQIDGDCADSFQYQIDPFGDGDDGPDPDQFITPSASDVRAAYQPLIDP